MEENDDELIDKFNKEIFNSTVENSNTVKEIIERCKLSEEFSLKMLKNSQYLQFVQTNIKKSEEELNRNSFMWKLLSILTSHDSLVLVFIENEIDEKIYSVIINPLCRLLNTNTTVKTDILSSFYNLISKDNEKRICNKTDLYKCTFWLLKLMPEFKSAPPSSLLIPFYNIILLFCENNEQFLNSLKNNVGIIDVYMLYPNERVSKLCEKVCELIDPFNEEEDDDDECENTEISKSDDNSTDSDNQPANTKLDLYLLRKHIMEDEKEKTDAKPLEIYKQREEEIKKELEKNDYKENIEKESRAPDGAINSNNKVNEDSYLLPQNSINHQQIDSHSIPSLSLPPTSNKINLVEREFNEVLKKKFDEYMENFLCDGCGSQLESDYVDGVISYPIECDTYGNKYTVTIEDGEIFFEPLQ